MPFCDFLDLSSVIGTTGTARIYRGILESMKATPLHPDKVSNTIGPSYGGFDFRDRVALVTGSTSGIGESCVRAFAAAGAKVLVTGRNKLRGRAIVDELVSEDQQACFEAADMADWSSGEQLVSACLDRWGRLDILVNNAGILHSGTALDTTLEVWKETLSVNLTAVFVLCRSAVPAMRLQGEGCIINVASEWGLNGQPGHVAYCASKGAVVQMTRSMALDHAEENIRVNAVCPGEIHTPLVDKIMRRAGGSLEEDAAAIPMKRVAEPYEVANCVLFLASPMASYVTGALLSVDGGADAIGGAYPSP